MPPSLDELLAYRPHLVDYATKLPLAQAPKSTLVHLHAPDSSPSGRLLTALNGVAEPAKKCSLVVDNVAFPPLTTQSLAPHLKYSFSVTFNRLLTAPTLHLKCLWTSHVKHPQPIFPNEPFKITMDFHLASQESGTGGIEDLHVQEGVLHYDGQLADELVFTAHPGTNISVTGLNNVLVARGLGEHGLQIITVLRSLIKPTAPVQIRLRFKTPIAGSSSAFANLLPFIVGSDKLPSLSAPEWNAFLPLVPDQTVENLIYSTTPFPMLPQDPSSTYTTPKHAAVELHEASRIAFLEQEIELTEWAKAPHSAIPTRIGELVVVAVRFAAYCDIPDRLRAEINWRDPESGERFGGMATRSTVTLRLPVVYDALFVFPNATKRLREACVHSSDVHLQRFIPITVNPQISRFTLEKQLETAFNLQHADSARWQPLILNQDHDQPIIDLALDRTPECVDTPVPAEVDKAYDWLLKWRDWNEEQLEALRSVRAAVGRVVLCTAPAGCGKTLVQQALCVFFYRLGLHVLVLMPANSNCTDFMGKLGECFTQDEVRATRVFPSSADIDAKRFLSHTSGNVPDAENVDFLDMELIRQDIQASGEKYSAYASYGLPAQVLAAARAAEYSHVENMNGSKVDIWAELKTILEANDNHTFSWSKKDLHHYQTVYDSCKSYYVAVSRMIVTTTGYVRTNAIVDNWAQDKHGSKCNGIVVIVDEAGKDKEIDTLSALLWPGFRKKITGMVLLGDERQLEPTNKSGKGADAVNPFAHRVSLPFLTRLKREGYPCTELIEQHRMSYHISDWPSKNFYPPPGMRNGPGTFKLLRLSQPGLYNCLRSILSSLGKDINFEWGEAAADEYLRTQYIEVLGHRQFVSGSAMVREHIRGFFNEIYWHLLAYYGANLSDECMVITAYKAQKNQWLDAVRTLQRRYGIPDKQMPTVMTIDSSQGSEASITIIDCSVQNCRPEKEYNGIGFVDDDRRMNVAFTRARDVRWVIGGHCGVGNRPRGFPGTPAYARYREETEATRLKHQLIEQWDGDWLKVLRKKDIKLPIRYTDDMARSGPGL